MREVSMEEFQKRMQPYWMKPAFYVFNDMIKADLVVFDREQFEQSLKELQKALGFSFDKEHPLRKILQEFEYFLVSWIENDIFLPRSNHCYPSQDLDIVLDFFFNFKQVFDETFAEDKRLKLFSAFQSTRNQWNRE